MRNDNSDKLKRLMAANRFMDSCIRRLHKDIGGAVGNFVNSIKNIRKNNNVYKEKMNSVANNPKAQKLKTMFSHPNTPKNEADAARNRYQKITSKTLAEAGQALKERNRGIRNAAIAGMGAAAVGGGVAAGVASSRSEAAKKGWQTRKRNGNA